MAKVEFTTGNFDLEIDGDISAEKRDAAITAGIRYIVQRDGASKAYKTLFGEDAGDKKRKELEYSEENAEAVRDAFEKAMAGYGDFSVTVSEHETTETAGSRKMAKELWNVVSNLPAGQKEAAMGLYGIAANATEDEAIEAAHTFLGGLRAKPVKKEKSAEG